MSHYISFVRIPALAVGALLRPTPDLGLLETDRLPMRVWPSGIDFNFHLNNARYLSVMDYGRVHMLARTGVLRALLRARWMPLVGAAWVTYRRSLRLWAKYTLETRLVCWDERWFYIEQTFTGGQGLAAVGWVKGALRAPDGVVAPQKVLEGIEPGIESPVMPDTIAAWNKITREKLMGA
ncbi:MAG TPA: thioesterase family protein [Terracidiphilus sp.]